MELPQHLLKKTLKNDVYPSMSPLSLTLHWAACLRILRENLRQWREFWMRIGIGETRGVSQKIHSWIACDPSLWSAQPAVQPLQWAQRRSINANKVSLARTILHGARGEKQLTQHAPRAHTAKGQRYIIHSLHAVCAPTRANATGAKSTRNPDFPRKSVLGIIFLLCT